MIEITDSHPRSAKGFFHSWEKNNKKTLLFKFQYFFFRRLRSIRRCSFGDERKTFLSSLGAIEPAQMSDLSAVAPGANRHF